jgi:hypothetical protein
VDKITKKSCQEVIPIASIILCTISCWCGDGAIVFVCGAAVFEDQGAEDVAGVLGAVLVLLLVFDDKEVMVSVVLECGIGNGVDVDADVDAFARMALVSTSMNFTRHVARLTSPFRHCRI